MSEARRKWCRISYSRMSICGSSLNTANKYTAYDSLNKISQQRQYRAFSLCLKSRLGKEKGVFCHRRLWLHRTILPVLQRHALHCLITDCSDILDLQLGSHVDPLHKRHKNCRIQSFIETRVLPIKTFVRRRNFFLVFMTLRLKNSLSVLVGSRETDYNWWSYSHPESVLTEQDFSGSGKRIKVCFSNSFTALLALTVWTVYFITFVFLKEFASIQLVITF